ncbi:MAG TPA: prepilin-type N-terminal cleavage/methylation domain-containing protein [Candidatus Pacearchaeota archaeon]|nr:prepilin-type N-terminal cleavage/methylation domain-containing protein [Candidatus Pacearchaeota archaeon]
MKDCLEKRKSFTLIELLVVIVIIGILAGVIMISTSSSINKADLAKGQAFSSTLNNELFSDLVSEWTFEEDSGTLIKDTWGSNNGTAYNTPQSLSGSKCVFGKCLQFSGSTSYVEVADSNSLDIQNAITLAAWIKTTSTAQQLIIQKSANSTFVDPWRLYSLLLTDESSKLKSRFSLSTGVAGSQIQLKGNTGLNLNEWYFIVGTWQSGSKARIFLNGKEDYPGGMTFAGPIAVNSELFRMANSPTNTERFYGVIDDTRIYNKMFTTAEVKQNYIAGLNSLLSKNLISKEDYNEKINALAYEE